MSLYTKIAFHQTKYNLKRVHPDCSCELHYEASGFKQCDSSNTRPLNMFLTQKNVTEVSTMVPVQELCVDSR